MVQVGIDVGSFNTSVVILADTTILAYYVVSSDEGESEPGRVTGLALEAAGLHWDGISTVVATGCGRSSVDFAHEKSSEVVCQARGSLWLFPEARTVINLGAESSRAISLNEQGKVRSFATNDKCAAGSGLFLESIAHLMGIPVAEMGELALGAETTEEVSSRCAVFAESEVISHIHRGVPKENILAGVHQAIADRILDLISKITVMPDVVFTGGMARNPALMKELEKRLGLKACIPAEPRIVGALGAALLAREKANKNL